MLLVIFYFFFFIFFISRLVKFQNFQLYHFLFSKWNMLPFSMNPVIQKWSPNYISAEDFSRWRHDTLILQMPKSCEIRDFQQHCNWLALVHLQIFILLFFIFFYLSFPFSNDFSILLYLFITHFFFNYGAFLVSVIPFFLFFVNECIYFFSFGDLIQLS